MNDSKVVAHNKGYDAWTKGESASNPYKYGTPEAYAWYDGYSEAQFDDTVGPEDTFTAVLGWIATVVILAFVIACVYFMVVV